VGGGFDDSISLRRIILVSPRKRGTSYIVSVKRKSKKKIKPLKTMASK
jgi:hypothetical protein